MLYYRDARAGKAIDDIKARLGANDVHIAVSMAGDAGVKAQTQGERYEAWLRGVMHDLDPLGLKDMRCREHQAADGLGVFELEFSGGYKPPLRQSEMTDKEYDQARDKAARECGLPVKLLAPDPRSLYTPAGQETPTIVIKVVNKPLIDIRELYTAEGFKLGYESDGERGRIAKRDYMLGGDMAPPSNSDTLDVGKYVRCVVVADCDYIYHLINPQPMTGPTTTLVGDNPGVVEDLLLLAKYPNPLGHPPFYFCPARTTSDPDPAYHYLPLAAEILELTPELDAVRSLRKIAAYREALKPIHAQPRLPGMADAASKGVPAGDPSALVTPGVLEWDGEFKNIPNPVMEDLDKYEQAILKDMQDLDASIHGALRTGAMGKATPAWAMSLYKEEENGFLSEGLTSRATGWRELLEDTTNLCRDRYAVGIPVYVSTTVADKKRPEKGRSDARIGLKAEDLKLDCTVNVTIDALTQSQRAADTEYWRRLRAEGTISQETYEDNIGIEDRIMEQRRKELEVIQGDAKPFAMNIARELVKGQVRAVFGQIGELVVGPGTQETSPVEQSETQAPGGEGVEPTAPNAQMGQPPSFPKMPGLGMSEQMPDALAEAQQPGAVPVPS